MGYSPWDHKESDVTDHAQTHRKWIQCSGCPVGTDSSGTTLPGNSARPRASTRSKGSSEGKRTHSPARPCLPFELGLAWTQKEDTNIFGKMNDQKARLYSLSLMCLCISQVLTLKMTTGENAKTEQPRVSFPSSLPWLISKLLLECVCLEKWNKNSWVRFVQCFHCCGKHKKQTCGQVTKRKLCNWVTVSELDSRRFLQLKLALHNVEGNGKIHTNKSKFYFFSPWNYVK